MESEERFFLSGNEVDYDVVRAILGDPVRVTPSAPSERDDEFLKRVTGGAGAKAGGGSERPRPKAKAESESESPEAEAGTGGGMKVEPKAGGRRAPSRVEEMAREAFAEADEHYEAALAAIRDAEGYIRRRAPENAVCALCEAVEELACAARHAGFADGARRARGVAR